MQKEEIAAAVAVERVAIADWLDGLTPEQLATPSLCAGWSVHHVAAHLTMLWNVSIPAMAVRVAKAGGSFPKAMQAVTAELVQRPVADLTAGMRANADNPKHPPTLRIAPLTDAIVHGDDMRLPLGAHRDVPGASVIAALRFITSGRDHGTFLPRKRLHGLRLIATDMDWSWGHGDELHGPGQSLLAAALGRRVALADLTGATPILDARL